MKVTIIPIVIGGFGTVTEGMVVGLEGLKNKGTSGHHSHFSIIEIGQNTKKRRGDP